MHSGRGTDACGDVVMRSARLLVAGHTRVLGVLHTGNIVPSAKTKQKTGWVLCVSVCVCELEALRGPLCQHSTAAIVAPRAQRCQTHVNTRHHTDERTHTRAHEFIHTPLEGVYTSQ